MNRHLTPLSIPATISPVRPPLRAVAAGTALVLPCALATALTASVATRDGTAATTVLTVALAAVGGFVAGYGGRMLLRGKGLSPPTLSCELPAAVLWAVLLARWRAGDCPQWWVSVPLAVSTLAVPLIVTDLRRRRLPTVLTRLGYPAFTAALVVPATGPPGPWLALRAVAGALVFAGAHAAVRLVAPGSLGAGDVKLAGSLGAVLGACGWAALPVAAVLAAAVTLLLALGAAVTGFRGWHDGVPHGPGLLAATLTLVTFPVFTVDLVPGALG